MENIRITVDEVIEESKINPFHMDNIGIIFNNMGLVKFRHLLNTPNVSGIPMYVLPINSGNIQSILHNLSRIMPYIKGITLRLVSPQTRRKLITYMNELIIDYIDRREMESSINIIHELTANAEKSNLERVIFEKKLASDEKEMVRLIRQEKETLMKMLNEKQKWVKVSWKFTHKIFKIEVKNNNPIENSNVGMIKDKVSTRLNHLAEGFTGEFDDKIGAGLGLFFVNFFRDEMKEKFDFESIFRIYQNDYNETIATLTVIFEKN